ncbi:HDIG domain-containing protein [Cytophagaceae bacterium DM2B3-1]|uniref:HDIG domain-containing protein n=1 Tax=Xanthocytophaga flava TaxID=3048013 RepID=A0ABT7CQ89_9BACT|nr:phosphonate degradation HD-domain oxygenase [Xanthocytophaga flavus]MDJ1472128.1 HDIG domain-containing protein [Xanthocytophaga flavus]MDJ1495125.1 HDIG domain-containing protein [Xanthocytophaga flavus]
METTTKQKIEEIFRLYEIHGADDYIGEPVSQVEHMTQAALLAEQQGYDEEVILAAFFHDFGHLCADETVGHMDGYGVTDHEKLGADYLRAVGFSEKIARLVESHVQAKRYLTFKNPDYYNNLSEASKKTLEFQGGRMSVGEAAAFEAEEWFYLYLQMRYWDEQAKEMNIPVPDLSIYKAMALRHLEK